MLRGSGSQPLVPPPGAGLAAPVPVVLVPGAPDILGLTLGAVGNDVKAGGAEVGLGIDPVVGCSGPASLTFGVMYSGSGRSSGSGTWVFSNSLLLMGGWSGESSSLI